VIDVFTVPTYRGRGLYSASTAVALAGARDAGFHRVVGMVAPWNRPALHVMQRKFARVAVGAVGYRGAGPWRRYYTRGAARFDAAGTLHLAREHVPTG
jgi:hypothetical protein